MANTSDWLLGYGQMKLEPGLPPGPARDLVSLFQELRYTAQLSNGQIAISTGLSRSHVSEVLRGLKAPSAEAAAKIAEALGGSAQAVKMARMFAEKLAELKQYERVNARATEPGPVAPSPPHGAFRQRTFARIFDPYVRKARIEPVLLVLLPPCLLGVLLVPATTVWIGMMITLAFGLPALVDHVARERGRRLEPDLFARWGGRPTTVLLRWSGPVGRTQQSHVHASVQKLVGSSLVLPSEVDERADPQAADDIYDAAITILRVAARQPGSNSQLVFEENCQYGFRRNSLGLRLLGISVAALTLAGSAAALIGRLPGDPDALLPVVFVGAATCVLLWYWIFIVNAEWVKLAAWSYATRLIETAVHT